MSSDAATMLLPTLPDPRPYRGEAVLFATAPAAFPDRRDVELQLISGQHAGTCLTSTPASHDSRLLYWGTTIRVDDDDFRMWYLGSDGQSLRLCHATSADGLTWAKPDLGVVDYAGSKHNNLCDFPTDYLHEPVTVIHDTDEQDPQRRFKLAFTYADTWWGTAYSADGVRWTLSPSSPIDGQFTGPGGVKFRDRYYLTGQGPSLPGSPQFRAMLVYSSDDFETWSFEGNGLPDRVPPVGDDINSGEQVHCGACLWNRGNVVVAVYSQWHGLPDDAAERARPGTSFTGDLGLAYSHDAKHYVEPIPNFAIVREDQQPRPTAKTNYDRMPPILQHGQGIENVGDTTYCWFGYWAGSSVYVASWERDRLGYVTPSSASGEVVSCPVEVVSGTVDLHVNASNLDGSGSLSVGVVDEAGHAVPGFEEAAVKVDGLRQPILWNSHRSLTPELGPVRLSVRLTGAARLHALYIGGGDGDGDGAYETA